MKKEVWITMGALLAVAAVITLLVTQNTVLDDIPVTPIETQSVEFSEEIQEQVETIYSQDTYIPEWFFYVSDYDYSFTYDGTKYSIPMKACEFPFSQVTILSGNLSDTLESGGITSISVMDSNGRMTFDIRNKTDAELPVSECNLISVRLSAWGNIDFIGPDGTRFGGDYSDLDYSKLPGDVEDTVENGNGYIRVYEYIDSGIDIGSIIYNYQNGKVNQMSIAYDGE